MDPHDLMQFAIEAARLGVAQVQSPFGCAIAIDGELLAATHNTVLRDRDITAHAEINALRQATPARSIHLPDAVVASTCEPCPMCMAALHWARVETVYFGADIQHAAAAGFNELDLSAAAVLQQGGSRVRLVGNVRAEACRQLFDEWLAEPERRAY